MERNVKYHGKQEPRGEVASSGGQSEGSPATLSNAPALSDETLLVTCCSMSPKQQLLIRHIPQRTAQARSAQHFLLHTCLPLHAKAPWMGQHPSEIGWDSPYCTKGHGPELLLTQISEEVQGTIRNCDARPSSKKGGRLWAGLTQRTRFHRASRNTQTGTSLTLRYERQGESYLCPG